MVYVQQCDSAGNKSSNSEVPARGESKITRDAFSLLFCVLKMCNETHRNTLYSLNFNYPYEKCQMLSPLENAFDLSLM